MSRRELAIDGAAELVHAPSSPSIPRLTRCGSSRSAGVERMPDLVYVQNDVLMLTSALSATRDRSLDLAVSHQRSNAGVVARADDRVAVVERGVGARGSRRGGARRGSPRARARMRRPARASGCGSSSSSRSPSASRSSPASAPQRRAGLAAGRGRGRSAAGSSAGAARPARGSLERRRARRGGRTRSTPTASWRPAGWRRAGRCRRTRRPRTGRARVGAAVEVGDDPAHHVVARRARPGRARSSGRARPRAARRRRWGSGPGRRARMSSSTDGRAGLAQRARKIARATASRGASSSTKRSPSAPCSVAPSPRTASVIRKPSRPRRPATAVGWNWTNSRSASAAPAARASSRPEPKEPGGLVVRDHSAAAPPVARTTARAAERRGRRREHAGAAPVASVEQPRARARPRAPRSPGARRRSADSSRRMRRPVALPPAWTIAADAVPALEAEREVAVAVGVEAHAERLEVADARRRLLAQDLGGRAAHEAAAGGERVLEVARRASPRRPARRPAPPCAQ